MNNLKIMKNDGKQFTILYEEFEMDNLDSFMLRILDTLREHLPIEGYQYLPVNVSVIIEEREEQG